MYMTAFGCHNAVIIPEYCCGFGVRNYIWKAYPGNLVGPSALFDGHPYLSRIMVRKEIFAKIRYENNSKHSGFHYEDWHFSCEITAIGWTFSVARGAVLFYRQRQDSLMRSNVADESRLIAPSRYFEPSRFLKIAWTEFTEAKRFESLVEPFTREEFLQTAGMTEIVQAANKIDPMISMGILQYVDAGTNIPVSKAAAMAYFQACMQVCSTNFSDILLVPFMAKGGAEKFILSVIEALQGDDPDSHLLVIATQKINNHEWLDKLPNGSVFLDLFSLCHDLSLKELEIVTLRLIQHISGVKRIHMKNCEFVDRFSRRYIRYLKGFDTTFYHFCDPQIIFNDAHFLNGQSFEFVSELGQQLTRVISDHKNNLTTLGNLVGPQYLPSLATIYNSCQISSEDRPDGLKARQRILWASRLDEQKRPHLVCRIAKALEKEGINADIDAYGGATYELIGAKIFIGAPGVTYCGSFDGLSSIPLDQYDAFLYTSAFDGLPNVVLEAMAAGLPVIAANVGGIGEAVTSETGYLLENGSEDALVEHYVRAIKELYDDWPEALRRGKNGRQLVARQHSSAAFSARVREIFDMAPPRTSQTVRRPRKEVAE